MKTIKIGRTVDNDYVVNDKYTSRNHAQLIVRGFGNVSVVDLGSKTGTFVNGRKIFSETKLKKGDVLKIGTQIIPWEDIAASGQKKLPVKVSVGNNKSLLYLIGGILLLALLGFGIYSLLSNSDYKRFERKGISLLLHKDFRYKNKSSNKNRLYFKNKDEEIYSLIKRYKKTDDFLDDYDNNIDGFKDYEEERYDDEELDIDFKETKINGKKAYIMELTDEDSDRLFFIGLIEGKKHFYEFLTKIPGEYDVEKNKEIMIKMIKSFKEKK